MKKLQIILIAGAFCLLIFSTKGNLSAQSPDGNSCEVVISDLEGYEIWEENTIDDCWRCELDPEPEPVYDQFGNYIGLLYTAVRVNEPVDEIICNETFNPEDFCQQKQVFTSSNDECEDLFVPDTP
ncbi:hypothetical protein [Parapedobacter sp. 10938]|uniref:hypothetical protein n=1 Tax=Parapedobacter flavus TaxID=3110225 RepID=UPI002DBF01B0|nr:hypothetical protein [Parapedobacter sp. 10938]MEC3879730.1 hypothetical protein [Parapedobacter sp. 10938]